MSSESRHSNSGKNIILIILSPFLQLAAFLSDVFSSNYRVTEIPLAGNEPCYCGSGKSYAKCHKKELKKQGKYTVKVIKTHLKTLERHETFKIRKDQQKLLREFKQGSINPLNRDGNFTDTSGYDSI